MSVENGRPMNVHESAYSLDVIALEANVGQVDPLEGSRVHCRPIRALAKWNVLTKSAAEADSAVVSKEPSSVP